MITDFKVSKKTKPPACCSFGCCGNKFGLIGRSNERVHTSVNRIKLTRRYAKRAERNIIRKFITSELEYIYST